MMYYYVELARAKRALRVALVLLGLFLLACIIFRLSVHNRMGMETSIVHSPTAHVTKTTLPDGSVRTVVDDAARQTHAVIVRHPSGAIDLDATEPKSTHTDHHADFVMGSSSMNERVEGNVLHTTLHYRPEIPVFDLGTLFLVTIPMGLIIASMLGGILAKENDGHLELAWTKPVSRERYALEGIVVDAAAIVVSQLLAIAATLLASLLFFVPRFGFSAETGWQILFALAATLAWYAIVTAASASLRRGPGVVVGIGWIVALLIPGIAGVLEGVSSVSAVAAWFYAIFHSLSFIDPIAYLTFHRNEPIMMPFSSSAGVLCALVAGYVALAVAQWRRVEA